MSQPEGYGAGNSTYEIWKNKANNVPNMKLYI